MKNIKTNTLKKKRKILITDTILRDAHQSLLATRMRTEDMLPICEKLDNIGYYSLEVWGGATFDTCLRFLREDPWQRLKALRKALPNTKLQMLLRGQNLVGYRHYPDDIVVKFIERAVKNGIDIYRIFDALNDIRNMETSIKTVRKMGAIVEATVCYTTSPVHTIESFVEMAMKLEDLGTDTICIKDMAGLLTPYVAYDLVKAMKERVKVPVHLHAHDSSGLASLSYLKAIEAGVDIIDTALSPLGSGTSQPPTESFVEALRGTPYDTELDINALSEIAEYFKKIRIKYKRFETGYMGVNTRTLITQIPGGMMSNLAHQLREQSALDKMDEVLNEIPNVRKDMGYPPLVTPTSQIVGTQATLNVLTGQRYKVITTETRNYFRGLYGKPPGDVDEKIRKNAIGDEKPVDCRPADLLEPELDRLTREIGGRAKGIDDVLSYALFPNVALEYFEQRDEGKLAPEPIDEPEEATGSQSSLPTLAPSEFNITVHGESYNVKVAGAGHKTEGKRPFFLKIDNRLEEVMIETLTEVLPAVAGHIEAETITQSIRPKAKKVGDITTSIPGKVTNIKVRVGDTVSAGDTVLVVEAMKMESEVHTPVDGTVKKINIEIGDSVNPDETLLIIE